MTQSSLLSGRFDDVGDVPSEEFRRALHEASDWIAGFREDLEHLPVTPDLKPGEFSARLEPVLPDEPTSLHELLEEFAGLIPGAMVHWSHPMFLGYFGWTTTGPGIVGEMLTSALNTNAMTWRTSPAATELETRVLEWIRQLMGLPAAFQGFVYDTASVSTMHALSIARERAAPGAREKGLAGRDLPQLRVYVSDQTHNSVDKGVITVGIGRENIVRIASDDRYRMDPQRLRAAIGRDRDAGMCPTAVVATAGTTSTGSVDPLRAIAEICRAENLWLHVDAAYGGAMALLEEGRSVVDGLELGDSIVFNPHKWLFVPLDFSVLLTRHPKELRSVFALGAEYLAGDASRSDIDYMDYGLQLGRRFRALKAWMVMRAFGASGLRARIAEHLRLARLFASLVRADTDFELVAPVTMGVVCFRANPRDRQLTAEQVDALNERLVESIVDGGELYLTRTRLRPGIAMRIGLGNILTNEDHIRRAWQIIVREYKRLIRREL